jgi:DNA-binding NarL/FixJ family response regulator
VISKDTEGRRLLETIRDIIGGKVHIFGLTDPFSIPLSIPVTAERVRALNLSKREVQVAGLLVEGLSNNEIAKALGIANITVRLHLRRVFQKVGARNRTDAVRIILMSAADAGATPPGRMAATSSAPVIEAAGFHTQRRSCNSSPDEEQSYRRLARL